MDFLAALAQSTTTDPGGGLGATIAIVSVLSTAATVVATTILNRRRGKSDLAGEALKEMELWKGRSQERDNTIATQQAEITALHEQNRALGRENAQLVRQEHQEVLERLEALIARAEASRIGAAGTHVKLDEIHTLVNDRLEKALSRIDELEAKIIASNREKKP